jgi:uncharacterized membrane protein
MAVLATIGVIDTGSITLKKWGLLGSLSCSSQGFFGCNGCEKVLSSAWGSLFGQPLSLFGFLAYCSVLALAIAPLVLHGEVRTELRQRIWWGLFLVSTGMAAFSAVLVGVMIFGVRDCCPFCILSALLSLALMVLSILSGEWEDRGQLIFRGVLLAMTVLIIGLGWSVSVIRPASSLAKGVAPAVELVPIVVVVTVRTGVAGTTLAVSSPSSISRRRAAAGRGSAAIFAASCGAAA